MSAGHDVVSVLVADDRPDVRLLLQRALERSGFGVLLAATGDEALALAREKHPPVALLDNNMPGMTGLAVAAAIADDPDLCDIRVAITSISVMPDDAGARNRRGVHAYLPKPFGVLEVVECVERLLRQRPA